MATPVIGFSAYSGTGKTTAMESLVRLLTERGVRVGVVKHDCHGFEIDHPGKDSFRHAQAGATAVVITSSEKTAEIRQRAESLEYCLRRIGDVDLILVEGFKHADIPRIGLCRKASGKASPNRRTGLPPSLQTMKRFRRPCRGSVLKIPPDWRILS